MPLTKDSLSTHLISQDKGYDHRVSIDSMIVTHHIPTLSNQLPNVGTSTDAKLEEGPQSKVNLLK